MLVGPDGTAVGSVSGGCVEGAVYELGESVVGSGVPRCPAAGQAPPTSGLLPALQGVPA